MRTLFNVTTAVRRIGFRSSWSAPGVTVLALVLLEGCAILPSHLHNANDAAAAKTAQTEFAAYDTGAASVYQAMLNNLEKFKVEQDRVLQDLAANRDRAFGTKTVLHFTGDDFRKHHDKLKEAVDQIDVKIKTGVRLYFERRKETIQEQATAKAAVARLTQAAADAKSESERWTQAIAAINKGLARVTPAAGKDGAAVATNIVKANLDPSTESGKRLSTLLQAPGINDTIMTLGLDLAKAQRRAADVRLVQLSRRAQLYEDAHSAVRLAEALLGLPADPQNPQGSLTRSWTGSLRNDLLLNSMTARRALAGQTPFEATPDDPHAGVKKITMYQDGMAEWLASVRHLAVADAMLTRTDRLLSLAEARLDHEESIVDSRAHDESWRAVVRSGLAGLVAFHNGGFTAEDAANIIRIAQAIALAFIAGGAQ